MVLPGILRTAIVAGIVVAIIALIADFFVKKTGKIPSYIVWLIALAVWVLWVFFGGSVSFS